MTSAREIALPAYEQAILAAERKAATQEAERLAEVARKRAERQAEFNAALPYLNEWFPGVEWEWEQDGDYGFDTIVYDASEGYPPSFKLRVHNPPKGVTIEVGDYVQDTSMPGYKYFSGTPIGSAAALGGYLKRKEERDAKRNR
jgi:hypothetical protein